MVHIGDLFHAPARIGEALPVTERKARLIATGATMLREHRVAANAGLGAAALPGYDDEAVILEGSTRGLTTYPEMEAAVYMTVAQMELSLSEATNMIRENIATLRKYRDHDALFPDWPTLCQRNATVDLKLLAAGRAAAKKANAAALLHAAA
ncbi:MAG TPA: hypothetical protein VFQ88_11080 [Nevskiaceae bacterium]|nr:hypothetical protein [Nevskiaceae bacterium]